RRLAADRLGYRCPDRQPLLRPHPRGVAAARTRRRAGDQRVEARADPERLSGGRDRRLRRRRGRDRRPHAAASARRGKEAARPCRGNLRAVEFRGRAPVPLDLARRRVAGRDGGCVRGHARPEDTAEPDHGAADPEGLLARVRLPDARRRDPVQVAQAGPRAAPDRRRRRKRRPDAGARQAAAPRDGHLHLERPRRPGPFRRGGRLQAARPPDRPAPDDRPAERDAGRHDSAGRDRALGRTAGDLAGRRRPPRQRRRPLLALRARPCTALRRAPAGRLHTQSASGRDREVERQDRREAGPSGELRAPARRPGSGRQRLDAEARRRGSRALRRARAARDPGKGRHPVWCACVCRSTGALATRRPERDCSSRVAGPPGPGEAGAVHTRSDRPRLRRRRGSDRESPLTSLAHAGGPVAAAGLALVMVAPRRDLRLAGLGAWLLGCAFLAAYLAPGGHTKVIAAAAALLAWELARGDDRVRELGPLAWPLALLVAWTGLSLAWTEDLREGAVALLFFWLPFGV